MTVSVRTVGRYKYRRFVHIQRARLYIQTSVYGFDVELTGARAECRWLDYKVIEKMRNIRV
jgi:hypothetical protein